MRYLIALVFYGLAFTVAAAEFRSVSVTPAVMYDAPSLKSRALFLYGENVPLELISSIEGWSRVRDAQGSIGWIEKSALSDQRWLQVRVNHAEVHEQPDDNSPIAFEAEQDVLLRLDEAPADPAMVSPTPGWVRVVHSGDGQSGYIRINRVFGL